MTRVFYSWQSDLPAKTNRTLIGDALERAAETVRAEETVDVVPVVDRDTRGILGTPDISSTIFDKISKANLFVADVSLINGRAKNRRVRRTPNPNVLIELGFAARALGWESVVCVINTAYGRIDDLPFDLRGRRCFAYSLNEDDAPAAERKKLEGLFVHLFRGLAAAADTTGDSNLDAVTSDAMTAIIGNLQGRAPRIRKLLEMLLSRLVSLQPLNANGQDHESLVHAIEGSIPLQLRWGELCARIAADGDEVSLLAACSLFECLLKHYRRTPGASAHYFDTDFDFFKFIGHESFVILIAVLLREQRWDLLNAAVSSKFLHETNSGAEHVDYSRLCRHPQLLRTRSAETNRMSVHADLLKARFTGALATVCSWDEFQDADLVLYLRDFSRHGQFAGWRPWSSLYLEDKTPLLYVRMRERGFAAGITQAIGLNIDELKHAIAKGSGDLKQLWRGAFFRLGDFDVASVATI